VLTLVGTINLAVFGAGLYYLTDTIGSERAATEQKNGERLLYILSNSINERSELRVGNILKWPAWDVVSDAVIVDRNPDGVSLNPVGSSQRDVLFDKEAISEVIELAIRTKKVISAMDGQALPIIDDSGNVWGGCWVRIASNTESVWLGLLPWFSLMTLLLFFGTFSVVRLYVLQPVRLLTAGARRVSDGESEFQVRVPRHSDELTDLILNFNKMSADVHGFQEHLANEVQAATEKATHAEAAAMRQRRLAAMGELAAGIAHEINNPLGGMLNAVEVLDRESTGPEKRRRYHALLQGGLERIQATVGKLLRFTPRTAELVPMDFGGPVRDALELVQHRAREQGVTLVEELPREPCIVLGQASELGQAVLNLLVNALDALEDKQEGSRIEVSLQQKGSEVVLSVIDNGTGILAENLEHVADLFYTTKEVGRGTGLGLALVHNVVDAHDGKVVLRNEPRGGLWVELILPSSGALGALTP
jgi:signal transduction histidine kinase